MKKLFSLVALLLCTGVGMMADVNTTLIDGITLPSLPSGTYVGGTEVTHKSNNKAVVVDTDGNAVMQASAPGYGSPTGDFSWANAADPNDGSWSTTGTTWSAPENSVFVGSAAYNNSNSAHNVAFERRCNLQSGRTFAYKFTNCGGVSALVMSNGNSADKAAVMAVYKVEGTTQTPVASVSSIKKDTDVLTVDNLTPSDTYVAYIYGTNEGNGALYEIAFLAPPAGPTITAADASITATESGVEVTREIAIEGKNLTGTELTATLSPEVPGLSVTLASSDIISGTISTTATLHYISTENAKGTTSLVLSDGTTTQKVAVSYMASVKNWELQTVAEAKTWDFTKDVTGGIELSDRNTEYVYANIEGLTFSDSFDATALAFKGQFPFRPDNTYAQNGTLHFKTTYPGEVTVTFSNTGSGEARYVIVNGTQGKSGATTSSQISETFKVEAGDVIVEGTASLRYYKVVFTPATTSVEVGDKLYRTFASSSALDFTEGVEGLTAYAAIVEGDNVKFEPITGKVPAKTGMLLKADAPGKYIILKALDETTAIENNAFIGVAGGTDTAEKGSFVLYDGEQGLGFYKTTAEAFTVEANTAYIPANVVSPARTFIALDGETTGVNAARSVEATDGKMFDLQGRQVSKPTKGLYISNGKKYIVK